jgi:hypothetical protein
MNMGRRNARNDNDKLVKHSAASTLRGVILYDGPVILERSLELFEGMHQATHPRKRMRIDSLPIHVLNDRLVNLYAHRSLHRANMIVVAINASQGLSFAAIRHLESYLKPRSGEKRALVAFLEGRSPAARKPGYAYDQLENIASRHGVDFVAHIADPAPYAAWPHLPETTTPQTPLFFE